jgi:hypothetical protein
MVPLIVKCYLQAKNGVLILSDSDKQRRNIISEENIEQVVATFDELRRIILDNSTVPFKDVIKAIAKIDVGTFYNYIYKGKQRGRVSGFTVENLSRYFNLPKELFTGMQELTEGFKGEMALRIRTDFSKVNEPPLQKVGHDDLIDLLNLIRMLDDALVAENDMSKLEESVKKLEHAQIIMKKKLDYLRELKEYKKMN